MRINYKQKQILKKLGIFIGILAFLYAGFGTYFYMEKQKTAGIYNVQIGPQQGNRAPAQFQVDDQGNKIYKTKNKKTVCWNCKDTWTKTSRQWLGYLFPSSLKPQSKKFSLQCASGVAEVALDMVEGLLVVTSGIMTLVLEPTIRYSQATDIIQNRINQVEYSLYYVTQGEILKFIGDKMVNLFLHLSDAIMEKKSHEICQTVATVIGFTSIGTKVAVRSGGHKMNANNKIDGKPDAPDAPTNVNRVENADTPNTPTNVNRVENADTPNTPTNINRVENANTPIANKAEAPNEIVGPVAPIAPIVSKAEAPTSPVGPVAPIANKAEAPNTSTPLTSKKVESTDTTIKTTDATKTKAEAPVIKADDVIIHRRSWKPKVAIVRSSAFLTGQSVHNKKEVSFQDYLDRMKDLYR